MFHTSANCCFLTIPKSSYRLALEITQSCPFSCEYCFTWSSPKREKFEVNIDLFIPKLIKLIEEFSVEDVLLTGGEPLSVINELSPLLLYLNEKRIPFSISSTLYNKNLFNTLCSFRPRAINLSVDPPVNIRLHSGFKSNFIEIEQKIEMVSQRNIPVKLTSVISRENIGGIQSLLKFFEAQIHKNDKISKIAFKREYQIGYAAGSMPFKRDELASVYDFISTWAKKIPIPITFVNWSEFNVPLQSCQAGKSLICVMQNGDVTPCSLLYNTSRSFNIGNILENSISELKKRLHSFHNDILKYNVKTENNTEACNNCEVKQSCGGGCLAALPIASNKLTRRTCEKSPEYTFDPQRMLLKDLHGYFHKIYAPSYKKFVSPEQPLSNSIELLIKKFVKENIHETDLAHTFDHVENVVILAKYISKMEGAATRITVPAAYFHDIAEREPAMHHMHTYKSAFLAYEFLEKLKEFSKDELEHIQYAICTSSYGSHLLGYRPLSLEANVVRDADFLMLLEQEV